MRDSNERFITGYMDLLFRKDEQVLSSGLEDEPAAGVHARAARAKRMDDADYHRQYQLYLQATARWLKRVHGPKFSFVDSFGGVFYLYLRGLNGRDDTCGVYFHRPTARDLDLDAVLRS